MGTLVAIAWADGHEFDGAYFILSLLLFSLTFPGTWHLHSSWPAFVGNVLFNWFLIVAILLFVGWATKMLDLFSPLSMLAFFTITPIALLAAHTGVRIAVPRVLARDARKHRAIIVGANKVGQRLAKAISGNKLHGLSVVGFVDDRASDRRETVNEPVLGKLSQLAVLVRQQRIDYIYIALPMASQPRILALLEDLRDTTASIYFVPDIFVADLIQARVDQIDGMPVVAVCDTPFYGVNGLIKRTSDLVLSSLILTLVSPIMIAIAIAVKMSSPGPVIFRQRRYGLDGREIWIYKFRSMTVCDDGDKIVQAKRKDQRVTRLGAILRKYSLDELPQFINVLQGRMSLVGPRPHAVAHNEMYRKIIKGYMVRHKVKPGVTGWAQVNGLRGETDTLEKMQARVECDLEYLRTWSLGLDLHIVFKTALVILFSRDNAY
jgi:putative colanic acid biosynthesis UDP-glucose lipid carrier transferase